MTSQLAIVFFLLLVAVVEENAADDCVNSCVGKNTADGQRYPHCSDCQSYVFCDAEGLHTRTCSANLYFNANANNCDTKENAVCGATTTTASTTTTTATTTTTTTTATAAPSCYDNCTSAMFNNMGTRYPVCGRCMHYLTCTNGEEEITKCPSGLYHNNEAQNCDYAANVDCTWGTTVPPALTQAPSGVCLQSCDNVAISNRRYPHCSNCSQYVQCLSSGFSVSTCPSGLYHKDPTQDCDFPNSTACYATTTTSTTSATATQQQQQQTTGTGTGTCVNDCTGRSDGNYQSCNTCYGYVACSGNMLYNMTCPAMLKWNDNERMCQASSDTCQSGGK